MGGGRWVRKTPPSTTPGARGVRTAWLLAAKRRADLVALGKKSRRFRDGLLDVDCDGAAAFRQRLKLPVDRAAALHAAHCGDVIVNQQAKHWNGGVAACACGHPEESRQHLFWECPRWVAVRAGFLDGK